MKVSLYLLLFYVCNMACDEDDENRKRILKQLTRTRTVILNDYHLVTRQIATDVYKYRNYRTVSVVFYPITRDVSEARFTFQAEEVHMNKIGRCGPQDVIINIKHGSYPAVNPDGYAFPKFFVDPKARNPIHTLEICSDATNASYSIYNPKPGYWYALVYKKWEDPRTRQVAQQGLVAECHTILYTDLQVKKENDIDAIECSEELFLDYSTLPATFKCMTVDSVEPLDFSINLINSSGSGLVKLLVQALSLPTDKDNLHACYFDAADPLTVNFIPYPNAWHYIRLERFENETNLKACDEFNKTEVEMDEFDNHTVIDLMRDDRGRFFTFEYGLATTNLQDVTSLVNLTSGHVKTLRFAVNQILDIGGTVVLEASLVMSLKYFMGYRRAPVKGSETLLAFSEDSQFIRVVVCLDIDHASVPLPSGDCRYNDQTKPALFILNSTDSSTIHNKVIIPFPESGYWYLTFRLFCDSVVCPCRSPGNGTYYVRASGLQGEIEDFGGNATRPGSTECNASVILAVGSTACVGGSCQNYGECLLNTIGGMVMSFCSCKLGYGAWDCSDVSRMDSWWAMLVSVLLLTMSNLLFFLSIYVATIRQYYTEAVMYTFTMVFSTFYHACDAPMQVSYCITKSRILQYGDFYCGIMCFWVTLLAMSIMHDKLRSALQLIGAITVALLTTWNMHSIYAFMLPVAVGCGLLLASWCWDWYRIRRFQYKRSYYTRFLPIGLVLVSIGLVCYAFLQTEQNYKIIHSIWHMIIAASVIFLLPDVKREPDAHPFLPSPNFCKLPKFWRRRDRSQTPAPRNND